MPPDLNIMEWPGSSPLCWVCWLACPKSLAWHLTQHNGRGFDHSVVPYTFTQSCSHTNSLFHFFNLCSRAKISQRRKELEVYKNWSVLKPHVTSSEKCVTNRRGLIHLAHFTTKLITGNSSQRTNFVCFGHPLSIVSLQNQGYYDTGGLDHEACWESSRKGHLLVHAFESNQRMEEGPSMESWKPSSKFQRYKP